MSVTTRMLPVAGRREAVSFAAAYGFNPCQPPLPGQQPSGRTVPSPGHVRPDDIGQGETLTHGRV